MEIWSSEVKMFRENALVAASLVKRFDNLVKEKGDTIHIPDISELSANDKTANNEVTLQTVTESQSNLSIDTHKEVSFEIEDIVKTQSAYDLKEILGSFYCKVVNKLLKLRETLSETIRSQARTVREGSETIIAPLFNQGEGIVRPVW